MTKNIKFAALFQSYKNLPLFSWRWKLRM